MTVERRGKDFVVVSHKSGKVLGTHDTERKAKTHLAAINIGKARKAGHRIPKRG